MNVKLYGIKPKTANSQMRAFNSQLFTTTGRFIMKKGKIQGDCNEVNGVASENGKSKINFKKFRNFKFEIFGKN